MGTTLEIDSHCILKKLRHQHGLVLCPLSPLLTLPFLSSEASIFPAIFMSFSLNSLHTPHITKLAGDVPS